jgi:hypothetical protein
MVRLLGIRRWQGSGWRCTALFLITLKMNIDSIWNWHCTEFGIKPSLKLSPVLFDLLRMSKTKIGEAYALTTEPLCCYCQLQQSECFLRS